jgi:glycosyltransferase involved in cell wall biosynthesis
MEAQPRLSIGIPVYNGERFLEELLINLLNQTFKDFEIVICDNASTDRTEELCLSYARGEPRIRYYRNKQNLGAHPNFNKVYALSTAPLFKWAAHDDLYEPSFLSRCIQILDANPDVVVAHSDCVFADELRRPFTATAADAYIDPRSGSIFKLDPAGLVEGRSATRRFWNVLFRMQCGTQIFGVIRREALARTGLVRDFYGADKLILAELALLGRFAQIREKLFIKRWSNSTDNAYSLRLRQLAAFSSAPFGKGLSAVGIGACLGMVSLLGPKVILSSLMGEARRQELLSRPWRSQDETKAVDNASARPFLEDQR